MVKAGDWVIWIEASNDYFTNGKKYLVEEVYGAIGEEHLLYVKDDKGMLRGRRLARFKPTDDVRVFVCTRETHKVKGIHGVGYKLIKEEGQYLILEGIGKVKAERFTELGHAPVIKAPATLFLNKLEEKVGKGYKMDSVACYMIDRGEVSWNTKDVCHARLRGGVGTKGAATWIKSAYVGNKHLATYREYVDWIVNKSIFSKAFLHNCSLDRMMESGVEFDVTAPANVVFTGAVALRMFHEHKYFREVFHKLYEEGFDMEVCFVVAHGYKAKGYWGGLDDWHGVLSDTTCKALKKVFKEGLLKTSNQFNSTDRWDDYFCARGFAEVGEGVNTLVKTYLNKRFKRKVEGGWGAVVEQIPITAASAIAVLLTKELK
jgi:hypothetical protein